METYPGTNLRSLLYRSSWQRGWVRLKFGSSGASGSGSTCWEHKEWMWLAQRHWESFQSLGLYSHHLTFLLLTTPILLLLKEVLKKNRVHHLLSPSCAWLICLFSLDEDPLTLAYPPYSSRLFFPGLFNEAPDIFSKPSCIKKTATWSSFISSRLQSRKDRFLSNAFRVSRNSE